MLALDRRRIPNGIDRLQVDFGRISPDAAGIFGSVQSGKTKKNLLAAKSLIVGSYEPGENSVRSCDRHVWRIE